VGEEFGMPSGGYVFHEAGIASNEHGAWVVKKDDGAIWATDVDPVDITDDRRPLSSR
jgi:hypothetical protein